jgi:hypothetical protein
MQRGIWLALWLFIQPMHASIASTVTFESRETPTLLLELFSSEGCSSCPPAESWMSQLKNSSGLWRDFVPVVFHVDYWDRLGWPDRFASPEFTLRQRQYSGAWAADSVYTPGFVIDGKEWRGWFTGEHLPAPGSSKVGTLKVLVSDGTRAEIVFKPGSSLPDSAQVELALLGNNLESVVKRGENGGRKLRHDFLVLNLLKTHLVKNGDLMTASIDLPKRMNEEPTALAAWINTGSATPSIQATGGWLRPAGLADAKR